MKKIVLTLLTFISIVVASGVIYFNYWPFAKQYVSAEQGVGDSATHLANIFTFRRHHTFPIMSWQSEYFAGYPTVEGYPWLHYYTIQPVLSLFKTPGLAMDYYAAIFLLLYYLVSFLLLFRVSRNVFLSLLFSLVLVYGADSGMSLFVNSFVIFTASQFFLPLTLLLVIIARERSSAKLYLLSAIFLAISFYAHGAMTGIVMIPAILPFLVFGRKGNITRKSIVNTINYFLVFAFLSSIQIYQFLSYSFQGQDISSIVPHPLSDIPARYLYMFSWQNPILLPLVVLLIPLLILAARKSFSYIKPYFFSFLGVFFVFSLMVFKLTGLVIILLGERALWGMSLTFLLLLAAVIRRLVGSGAKRSIFVGVLGLVLTAVYMYVTLVVKNPLLIPDITRQMQPYGYLTDAKDDDDRTIIIDKKRKYENKYDSIHEYPPLSWNQEFDNYRTDGISYNIYSNWALWSSNPRYKARYPAMKGLPLHWSGLVSGAEYGILGEAGTPDTSEWAMKQSVFFFDWYGIRHFEIGDRDPDLAIFLRKEPYITETETSGNLIYYSLDKKYVGPIYAPTNAKIMAVVAPEEQYDNFIRTLSYSDFTSRKLIPIYMGSSMGSLNKANIKDFDAIFLYGYKQSFLSDKWSMLADYVKKGGNLIIETGQKVRETHYNSLPEVFPVQATKMTVITKPWNLEVKESEIAKDVNKADFSPLNTKYLPYSISEAASEAVRSWGKPVLAKDGSIVLAFGLLGEGKVAWSGINLPFHAIDNRNTSETAIFANILNWFFREIDDPITDFTVDLPDYENIIIKSSQGKGVLLKEHYNPGWSARLNGEKAKIYKAGLLLMYVPFENAGENVVELTYYGAPIHWILFVIALISFIGVMIYILFNKNVLHLFPKPKIIETQDTDTDY